MIRMVSNIVVLYVLRFLAAGDRAVTSWFELIPLPGNQLLVWQRSRVQPCLPLRNTGCARACARLDRLGPALRQEVGSSISQHTLQALRVTHGPWLPVGYVGIPFSWRKKKKTSYAVTSGGSKSHLEVLRCSHLFFHRAFLHMSPHEARPGETVVIYGRCQFGTGARINNFPYQ